MTRLLDLIILAAFVACIGCAYYLGDQQGRKAGYDSGQLSVYKLIMGGAVMNLASLPVREDKR